jgi:hypothetical protein
MAKASRAQNFQPIKDWLATTREFTSDTLRGWLAPDSFEETDQPRQLVLATIDGERGWYELRPELKNEPTKSQRYVRRVAQLEQRLTLLEQHLPPTGDPTKFFYHTLQAGRLFALLGVDAIPKGGRDRKFTDEQEAELKVKV